MERLTCLSEWLPNNRIASSVPSGVLVTAPINKLWESWEQATATAARLHVQQPTQMLFLAWKVINFSFFCTRWVLYYSWIITNSISTSRSTEGVLTMALRVALKLKRL